ncbi:hypothetical protein IFO70_00185 [Phormidium tenue FACHB-886]|nr:hypothetical protein [Phormidium tenue FACHB-886]
MSNFISQTFSNLFSFFKSFKVKHCLALLMTGFLVFGFGIQAANADETLGERFRDKLEQTDRSTERPKTTGQFKDEVSGDVPLSERIENTVRDSAEAFSQFGKEYSTGAKESARSVTEKAAEAGNKVSDTVR